MGSRALVFSVGLLLASTGARAEQSPVRIEYSAPESCPDAAEFERRVRERIQRARFAKEGEIARTFRVIVQSKPERSVARVEFVDADGEKVSRTLGADTCDEVVNAIALVTALAMEARAGSEEPAPAPGARPPTGATPEPAPLAPPPPPPAATRADDGARWDAGMGVDIASGYAPSISVGLRLFVEMAPSFFSVRASVLHADSGKVGVEDGRTRFRFWGARVEGCPLRVPLGASFAVSPCAGVEGGALQGEGLSGGGIVETREATEPWLAALALGRLQAEVDSFLLLEAQADVRFPLVRHEFYLERPDRSVHDVPAVAFGASLGVGFRFH
jgi:hypothetical protein